MEDIKQRQIEQLQRDKDSGRDSFRQDRELHQSSNSSPQRRFIEVPIRFGEVTRKRWAGGTLRGGYCERSERTYVHTYQYKI